MLLHDQRAKKETDTAMEEGGRGVHNHPAVYQGVTWGVGASHSRPWLPRRGATALRGRATKLMGDVVVILLSERQTDRQTGETKTDRKKHRKEKRYLVMGYCSTTVSHQMSVFRHL